MDTRRNESYSLISCFVAIITSTYGMSLAKSECAIDVLVATYKLPPAITPNQAELTIAGLKKAEADCKDDYLSFRIRYRIGVIYLKAGMSESAEVSFKQIANDPECPELIRACSLNMIGQISRLRGENKAALDAFKKVADQFEQYLQNDPTDNLFYSKLLFSALFSRAEILELEQNFSAGVTEYRRLLNILRRDENKEVTDRYIPLINDRVSQLYLRQGDIDNYTKFAEKLIRNYPQYYRTPVVELEMECIKFLKSVSANPVFANGSFAVMAQVIMCFKDSKGVNSAQSIVQKLDTLCKEHQNTYAGILLHYHYACLLDALGDKEKATEILTRIFSDNFVNTNRKSLGEAIESVREYAKIQYAVTSAEMTEYRQALRVLSSLRFSPDNSHISDMAKSVTESIHVLRREVSVNDSAEK
jgi:tetratricopeptide (TPR) repeat protein